MSELSDARATVTLVNLNQSQPRSVIVQGGGYGEHQFVRAWSGAKTARINAPLLTVQLEPGCGQAIVFEMKRYANAPTIRHPWQRQASAHSP